MKLRAITLVLGTEFSKTDTFRAGVLYFAVSPISITLASTTNTRPKLKIKVGRTAKRALCVKIPFIQRWLILPTLHILDQEEVEAIKVIGGKDQCTANSS